MDWLNEMIPLYHASCMEDEGLLRGFRFEELMTVAALAIYFQGEEEGWDRAIRLYLQYPDPEYGHANYIDTLLEKQTIWIRKPQKRIEEFTLLIERVIDQSKWSTARVILDHLRINNRFTVAEERAFEHLQALYEDIDSQEKREEQGEWMLWIPH